VIIVVAVVGMIVAVAAAMVVGASGGHAVFVSVRWWRPPVTRWSA
jgi:hypothetical protein